MSKSNRDRKGLSPMQSQIATLELAWQFFLPGEQPPLLPHVCGWLKRAPIAVIIGLIEQAGAESVPRARHWIFNEILKRSETRETA